MFCCVTYLICCKDAWIAFVVTTYVAIAGVTLSTQASTHITDFLTQLTLNLFI